jgi:hypothetical protein
MIMLPADVLAVISATLRLERSLHLGEISAEPTQHILDHVIRPDIETLHLNFRRQVSISQMPSKAYELIRHLVSHFYNEFRGGLDL